MPTSYEIDTTQRLVRMRASGVFSNADLRDCYRRLVVDIRFEPTFFQLTDLDDVAEFAIDAGVIAEIAWWPVFRVGARRAIVAASDVAYGLSRMFSLHAECVGQNVRVFREKQKAVDWLNSLAVPGLLPRIAPAVPGVRIMAA